MTEYNFDYALKAILFWEGGLVDDKYDPGGKTKWGLSTRFLKKIGIKKVDIVTRDMMISIYSNYFWLPCKCDKLFPYLSLAVFDCAVNQGVPRAIKILQKTLGVKVDGIIGPKTLSAASTIRSQLALRDYMARRAVHYSSLIKIIRYGLGWFRRLFDIHHRCILLIKSPPQP